MLPFCKVLSAIRALLRPGWKARLGSYELTRKLKVGIHVTLITGTLKN